MKICSDHTLPSRRGGGVDEKMIASDHTGGDELVAIGPSDKTLKLPESCPGGGGVDQKMIASDDTLLESNKSAWADLHPELTAIICGKLNPVEYSLFKQVCSGWRTGAKLATNDSQYTWVLSKRLTSGKISIVNMESKRRYTSRTGLKGWMIIGSYQSWLLAYQASTNSVKLVHVFSGRTLQLPRIPHRLQVAAFTMDHDPCQDEARIYLISGERGLVFLLTLQMKDPEWYISTITIGLGFDNRFVDAMYLVEGDLILTDGEYEGHVNLKQPLSFSPRELGGEVDDATRAEIEEVGFLLRDCASCKNGQVKLIGCKVNEVRIPTQMFKFGCGKRAVACFITSSTLEEDPCSENSC